MKVLCGEPQNYSKIGLEEIEKKYQLTKKKLNQDIFEKESKKYQVLMVRLNLKITENMMHDDLVAIITPTTGLDHIDISSAEKKRIQVFSLYGETEFLKNITSTAEHTLGLLLSIVRKIPFASESIKDNEWNPSNFRGIQLKGKKLGIVGYGRLGKMIAKYTKALDMHVSVFDPNKKNCDVDFNCDSLEELLSNCDIISVHAPLDEKTKYMIGANELKLMKKGSYLINTSRGDIIDELALLKMLKTGHIAGAAVDVVSDEHKDEMIKYAKNYDNLIITPHIAGAAQEAIEQTDIFVINKFLDWASNK